MKIPHRILIAPDVETYCKKRKIRNQFIKSKNNILQGYVLGGSQLRVREPRKDQKGYFRINKQYRAIGMFHGDDLLIVAIDDHQ